MSDVFDIGPEGRHLREVALTLAVKHVDPVTDICPNCRINLTYPPNQTSVIDLAWHFENYLREGRS